MMLVRVGILLSAVALVSVTAAGGYEAYSGAGSENVEGGASSSEALAPAAPIAPPRVPMPESTNIAASFGYRPPPPPLRRDEKSIGQCSFDSSKWEIEPQSAIAHAIMFDRTTGLSCEECLQKCTEFQDASTQWICRTLTYDNKWKICDLFAVNGTQYPYFLTQYHGRDYFVYLAALPPTDAQLTVEETTEAAAASSTAAPTTAAPSGGNAEGGVASSSAEKIETNEVTPSEVEESAPVEATFEDETAAAPGITASAPAPAPEASSAAPAPAAAPASGTASTSEQSSATSTSSQQSSSSSSSSAQSSSSSTSSASATAEYQAVQRNGPAKSGAGHCRIGEVARYTQFDSSERTNPGDEVFFAPAKTREDCATACEQQSIFSCASAVYSPSGCELSISAANHSEIDALTPSKTAVYLEKTCLPKELAEGTSNIFPAVPNFVLVGHIQEVTDADSLAECQVACLRAQKDYGFSCKSAMWYPSDEAQNCLLNAQSRLTHPDVFVNEDQGVNMVYFEIPQSESDFKKSGFPSRFRDLPIDDGSDSKWTRWSKCKKDLTGMRYRYLKCTDKKDIRKCPKETVMCRHLPALQIQNIEKIGECRAVLDSHGRKRCPHGIRINKQNRKEYCSKPVDC
uniref:PAN domain-containing protein n=1 Tax=Panagrellus redivivus TaxID=6233 RepID=A0A7E4VAX8_PANRE